MAVLTVQPIARAGLETAFVSAAGGGDSIPNDGRTFVEIVTIATGITVTVVTQQTVDGKAVADDAIVIGTNRRFVIGPWPKSIYNDVNDQVQLTYTAVTSVTIAALRLP